MSNYPDNLSSYAFNTYIANSDEKINAAAQFVDMVNELSHTIFDVIAKELNGYVAFNEKRKKDALEYISQMLTDGVVYDEYYKCLNIVEDEGDY